MPQHDCFCAICSASVWCATIRQRKAEGDKSPELKEDDESERGYDPEIVSKEDVDWIEKLHILGFNSQAPGMNEDFVDICLTRSTIEDEDVFDNIDKDLLYKTSRQSCRSYAIVTQGPLKLNYGEPAPTIDGFEDAFSGQELFVVFPLSTPTLQSAIEAIVESNNFTIPRSSDNIGLCVKQDDFSKLPSELIHKIVDMLPAEPLLMLSRASWTVTCVLRNNECFWMQRIRCDLLWFFELQYLLDSPDTFQGKDLKGMFLWAHETSRSRIWMKSPFLGLANRRRIWGVREQLKEEYLSELKQIKDGLEPNCVKITIQERSACVHSPVVCSPIPERKKGSAVCWVHSWEDVFIKPKVLEIFWSSEGSLVGLSLAPENERRLFGTDDKTKGVFKEFIEVESGVWITGFVLHIPVFEDKHFWNEREMRKKVINNTGKSSCFGSTQQGHARLPLLGASSHFINGISGQMSVRIILVFIS
ncbi:hypothetical protein HYALB_00001961 [Hymenoscyphus albidus]|uniref:F-box domain-containing protein n=1 Tax=Hymenoscyphus albidus TaxID=595503 RepID=A0A9N9PXL6_9HELO|nr:hypothetical protein HYALB_00001961 [Hymenoscyphus albidus]